jgi:hypothetical protein
MRRTTLLAMLLVVPMLAGAQGLGQVGIRAVEVRTTDSAHLYGGGAALTYGAAAYKNLGVSFGLSAVRIAKATVPTAAVDLVYTPSQFLSTKLTPYVGGEANSTHLPGTTVPGYVVFAGTTINDLLHPHKARSVFSGQRSEVVPGFFIEGRVGQFVRNGRYHELDFGYAF